MQKFKYSATVKKIWSNNWVRRIVILLAIVIGGGYLYRDLHLAIRKIKKIPDVIVENISLEREINGKKWKLISPKMQHKDGIVYGDDLDLTITEQDGTVSNVKAKKGIYIREKDFLQLKDADGSMLSQKKHYNMTTGQAEYDLKKDYWEFKNSVVLSDENNSVSGEAGSFDATNGNCEIKGKGKITWFEE